MVALFLAHKRCSQFSVVNGMLRCIVFEIIETLMVNANTANIRQLSGPEKLAGLSKPSP